MVVCGIALTSNIPIIVIYKRVGTMSKNGILTEYKNRQNIHKHEIVQFLDSKKSTTSISSSTLGIII